jgi:hypothetical protein
MVIRPALKQSWVTTTVWTSDPSDSKKNEGEACGEEEADRSGVELVELELPYPESESDSDCGERVSLLRFATWTGGAREGLDLRDCDTNLETR